MFRRLIFVVVASALLGIVGCASSTAPSSSSGCTVSSAPSPTCNPNQPGAVVSAANPQNYEPVMTPHLFVEEETKNLPTEGVVAAALMAETNPPRGGRFIPPGCPLTCLEYKIEIKMDPTPDDPYRATSVTAYPSNDGVTAIGESIGFAGGKNGETFTLPGGNAHYQVGAPFKFILLKATSSRKIYGGSEPVNTVTSIQVDFN